MLSALFHADYRSDRAAFDVALETFAQRSGRALQVHREWLDDALCVTAGELLAPQPERLCVLVNGIHGLEGYAGSAIQRHVLSDVLLRADAGTTSFLIVHALNPYGFAHFTRVNRQNVDLNRNCALTGEPLFAADSSAYASLAHVLGPKHAARTGAIARAQFYAQLLAARVQRGERVVREASIGGQYVDAQGVFWGGARVQPEIRFFQRLYSRLAEQHREVLVIDLHTGYGDRGEAYALFGRADSPEIAACSAAGVSDGKGHDRTYSVSGDLVGYCYRTAKHAQPRGICNGVALEIGTHALTIAAQLSDLYTVVLENQIRHHTSEDPDVAAHVRTAFRELFYPSGAVWRTRAVTVGARCVEALLYARGFLRMS